MREIVEFIFRDIFTFIGFIIIITVISDIIIDYIYVILNIKTVIESENEINKLYKLANKRLEYLESTEDSMEKKYRIQELTSFIVELQRIKLNKLNKLNKPKK